MQNTPKTIEERIKKFGNKLAFELKPSNDTMEAIRLMREKLPELLAEQDRISRESEKQIIAELFKNGEWRKMIDKNGSNDFDVMTRAFLEALTNKE